MLSNGTLRTLTTVINPITFLIHCVRMEFRLPARLEFGQHVTVHKIAFYVHHIIMLLFIAAM